MGFGEVTYICPLIDKEEESVLLSFGASHVKCSISRVRICLVDINPKFQELV